MAKGGIKGGESYSKSDRIGYRAVIDSVSVHDLHATMLHFLDLNHKRLRYVHNDRSFRLTDVAGQVMQPILV